MLRRFFLISLLCLSSAVSAQESSEPSEKEVQQEEQEIDKEFWLSEDDQEERAQPADVRQLFYKTIVLVVFLSGAVLAGGWLLKRTTGNKFNSFNTEGAIQLIERKYISPKTSVWFVKINEKPIVIVEGVHGVAVHSLSYEDKKIGLSP